MNDAKWWLVCYDVHDPARLRRAAKLLEGTGERVQYSVFRCWLNPTQVQRLRWELTCVEAVAPSRLVSGVRGDFVGTGTWTLTEVEGGTRVVLDWDVEVRKPVVRHLTPLLRPLFAWNHRWAMQRGQERIVRLLEEASPASSRRGSRPPVPGLRRRSA